MKNKLADFAKKHKKVIIIAAAVVAALAAGTVWAAAQLPKDDRIVHGVVTDGTELGGMTVEEAEKALAGSRFYDNKDFVLVSGGERAEVSGDDIGLTADASASAQAAYSVGRGEGFFGNVFKCVKLAFSKLEMNPVPAADEESLDAILYDLGVRINGEMREAELEEISETAVKVIPPTAGQSKDVSKSREEVLLKLQEGSFGEIAIDMPISDPGKLTAEQVYAVVYRPAADAEYKLEGKELFIVDEITGIDVDKDEISKKLSQFNSGEEIELNVTRLAPENTAASLREGLFAAELSSYSSTYSTAAANRAANVALAASSVNGTILLPGDTFSYNAVIGNPSLANGYKVAPVYENGKTSEGVGGGVCQVSSTLYSAVLYANLEIVERRNHSLTVAYVPKGQDATVAYGAIDFKFKNNTDRPIRIDASAKGGKCVVSVIGTQTNPGQSVSIENTVVAATEPTVNETNDPEMLEGTRKVTSSGKTGYVVDSTRIVSQNGQVVKTEKLGRSTYKMVPTEVNVGTKPAPTPTPAPTPPPVPETEPASAQEVQEPEQAADEE